MSLNTAPLNTNPLNEPSGGVLLIISEILTALASNTAIETKVVLEEVNFQDDTLPDLIARLEEAIRVNSSLTPYGIFEGSLTDVINLSDHILLSTLESILEALSTTSTLSFERIQLQNLLETIQLQEGISTLTSVLSNLSEVFTLLEILDQGILKSILENIRVSSILESLSSLLNTVIETSRVSDSDFLSVLQFLKVSDNLVLSETSETSGLFESLLSEDFIISVKDNSDNKEYTSYLLSPETFSVSTYSNYNFIGSCKLFDDYLFINENGLYKYGGVLDDADIIQSTVQTAALSFGSSNLKQVPTFYAGLSNSNELVLKVKVDGTTESLYKLTKKTDHLQTQRIGIGKGLIGRYFQFEIVTQDNTEFRLDDLEFHPLILKRKL